MTSVTEIGVATRGTEGEDVVAVGVLTFAATSSSSLVCTPPSMFNTLSSDCLFTIPIPVPAPDAELNIRLSPPSPLLLLLLCLRELLPLRGSLALLATDFDESAEIVEVRRLAAGERGAGRIDEREGELGENDDVCVCVSSVELSVGRDCNWTSNCVSISAAVDPAVEKGNDVSVGVAGECISMMGGGFGCCKSDVESGDSVVLDSTPGSVVVMVSCALFSVSLSWREFGADVLLVLSGDTGSASEEDFLRGGGLIANSWASRTGGERKEDDGDGKGDAEDWVSKWRDHDGAGIAALSNHRCPQF